MSVGHAARLLEEAGISTVIIAARAFRSFIEKMNVPRALITPHVMGRPVGPPSSRERQTETVLAAMDLLETAERGGRLVEMAGAYRVGA